MVGQQINITICDNCDAPPEPEAFVPVVVTEEEIVVIKKEEEFLEKLEVIEDTFDESTYENGAPYLEPEPPRSFIAYTGKSVTLSFGAPIDPDLNPIEVEFDLGSFESYVTLSEMTMTVNGDVTDDDSLVGEVFKFSIKLTDDPLFNSKSTTYDFTLEFYQGYSDFVDEEEEEDEEAEEIIEQAIEDNEARAEIIRLPDKVV